MPTVVTKTVKPSGGDYTSLHDAIAGVAALYPNFVTADVQVDIACYAMLDTTVCNTNPNITTDATHYLRITVPTSERHQGKRPTSSCYRLEAAGNFNNAVTIYTNYVRLEGLAVKNSSTAPKCALTIACTSATASEVRVSDCITYDVADSNQGPVGYGLQQCASLKMNNCLAINTGAGFYVQASGTLNATLENCDAVNCRATNGTAAGCGFYCADFRTMTLKNCYGGGNRVADYGHGVNATWSTTNCYSSDGSLSTMVAAWSTANFTNVTVGSENVSLVAGSALIDQGIDLSADAGWIEPGGAVDIIGTTRPQGSAWDIGAFEYLSAISYSGWGQIPI